MAYHTWWTVTVEEGQVNTTACSPGAFIQQYNWDNFICKVYCMELEAHADIKVDFSTQ